MLTYIKLISRKILTNREIYSKTRKSGIRNECVKTFQCFSSMCNFRSFLFHMKFIISLYYRELSIYFLIFIISHI